MKYQRYKRRAGNRGAPKQRILIVTEGTKTEPYYFQSFRVSSAFVEIDGAGRNTDSLVEWAIELKKQAAKDKEPYDQIWCVFDKDSCPLQNFNRALKLADNQGLKIAYTNEAFELWYLLHFDYHTSGISRNQYAGMLTIRLGRDYRKNDTTIYDELKARQPAALRNASTLLATYAPPDPGKNNPSTTVHLLIQELNKYL